MFEIVVKKQKREENKKTPRRGVRPAGYRRCTGGGLDLERRRRFKPDNDFVYILLLLLLLLYFDIFLIGVYLGIFW